jgi:uncharacterized membrane protein (DUF485 family)
VRLEVRKGTVALAKPVCPCCRRGRTEPEAPMHDVARSLATSKAIDETGQTPAMFAQDGEPPPLPSGPDYEGIRRSDEFVALRSRLRWFVFPMSLLFFAWYMTYVLLAAYAHNFMSIRVFGQVNIAILLGLLQFVTTAAITGAYIRFANRRLDPQIERIRRQAGEKHP